MKQKSKRSGASVCRNPIHQGIGKLKRHRIRNQEKQQGRIERELCFESSRQRHL